MHIKYKIGFYTHTGTNGLPETDGGRRREKFQLDIKGAINRVRLLRDGFFRQISFQFSSRALR